MCVRSFSSQSFCKLVFLLCILILGVSGAAFAQGSGYWHTSGNQIIDSSGKTVRIAGINWYGFETTDQVVHGLWAQDYHTILNAIKNNGYNTIRLPYSNQMVESPIVPSNISYNNSSGPINTDLILDNHRSDAGNSAEANGLWYTSAYPESAWINDWKTMVNAIQASRTRAAIPR
jgi:endoglucanase